MKRAIKFGVGIGALAMMGLLRLPISGKVTGGLSDAGCGGGVPASQTIPSQTTASEATPAHKAHDSTAGTWDSCFQTEYDSVNSGCTYPAFCLEQWGSYAMSCSWNSTSTAGTCVAGNPPEYESGVKCGGVGPVLRYYQTGTVCSTSNPSNCWTTSTTSYGCRYGQWTNYNSSASSSLAASAYTCSEAPTASNVSFSYNSSNGELSGSYTYSQSLNGPEGSSKFAWQYSPTNAAIEAFTIGAAEKVNINSLASAITSLTGSVPSGTAYLRFCVTPVLDTIVNDGTNTDGSALVSGSQTCTSWTGWSTWSGPSGSNSSKATSVQATVNGELAQGSYLYGLSDTVAESGSTYQWNRASDSSGSNSSSVGSTKDRDIQTADQNSYLQFCVTQKNGSTTGTLACSGWSSVGALVQLYMNDSYGGANLNFAYQSNGAAHCYNLPDYAFNDQLSSFVWTAPSNGSAKLRLFANADCSGSEADRTLAAGASESISSISTTLGSSWNDYVSSFEVDYDDTVTVTNVTASITGNAATVSYTYTDAEGVPEQGTTHLWQRASDSNGSNATTVGTSATYTLQDADQYAYLRDCVTPSDGFTTGSQVCSAWVSVGPLLELFQSTNYGGASIFFAYEATPSGACFNMTSYGFNDEAESFKVSAPSSNDAALTLFTNVDCSTAISGGQQWTGLVTAGTTWLWPDMNTELGSSWNNSVSSFYVTYAAGSGNQPCGLMSSGQTLGSGQAVYSCNGQFVLIMQGDGNLVEYAATGGTAWGDGAALWASNTSGHSGATVTMQGDGNLVIYQNGTPLWATNTSGNSGAWLAVASNGDMIIYKSGSGTVLWQNGK